VPDPVGFGSIRFGQRTSRTLCRDPGLARLSKKQGFDPYARGVEHDVVVEKKVYVIRPAVLWCRSGQSWVATQRAAGTLTETDASETDRIRHAQKAFRTLKSHEARLLAASLAGDASSRHQGADAHPASHAD
ncbi:MAG: hypothetical protein AAFV38_15925, partial [Pseudomonadota bacterium]